MNKLFLFAITIPLLFTSGCVPRRTQRKSLINLKLGTTKEQVIKTLGFYPDVHRGSMKNKYGQIIDVWEYSVGQESIAVESVPEALIAAFLIVGTLGILLPVYLEEGRVEYYWLYFHNNILVQWGKAGDWQEANKMIHEIRFS